MWKVIKNNKQTNTFKETDLIINRLTSLIITIRQQFNNLNKTKKILIKDKFEYIKNDIDNLIKDIEYNK